ncbi:phosphoglycerate dehydrogenase [Candidatus Bathycorpusculum sp.]|uniref:phosphoglycerate dehydrogenase n=1 Tax=Candidatus Bathycorpusculum sp. TaxID=2994959 RepID=UPI00282F00FA|nr:ACT domain-containing protein [Candidatus Termitimicrobium sp.]MCL2432817.1 ACT domain-containing protein [Candidatus Termitimicrobium sp.]
MKVLINDGLEKEGLAVFQQAGIETDTKKRDASQLLSEIGQFDALVVRSATKVTREIIEAGTKGKLKIVGRAGVGYDNIDVAAASECGVVIKIAPYGSTNAVAELAFGLMLALSRNTPQAHHSLKNGVWIKKKLEGRELSFKTLGLIGCGRIGQKVARIAKLGFDMEIIGYDIKPCPESGIKFLTKEEVLQQSDYISIHTGGKDVVIGAKELALMKPTSYIINTSRGNNIDQETLYTALKDGRIAGYGTDVYKEEPKSEGDPFTDKLRELGNVVLSSHLGASTVEAQQETSTEIARVLSGYLLGGDFTNAVNAGESIDVEEKQVFTLFIHHKDVPGVFANIDKVLADNNINIRANYSRQINTGYAISVYVLHHEVTPEIITALKAIPNIANIKT